MSIIIYGDVTNLMYNFYVCLLIKFVEFFFISTVIYKEHGKTYIKWTLWTGWSLLEGLTTRYNRPSEEI